MKNLYAMYETDTSLETQGVKLDFGGASITVRRAGGSNKKYEAAFSERMRPHSRAIRMGTLGDDRSRELLMDVYFDAVVLGWENVTDKQGNVLEYNRANFKKLMTDLPELWDTVRVEANQLKNFQNAAAEDGEALGN